jgi:hypothetical protein
MATRMIRKKEITNQEHVALALWAADCAEHVLPYFEKEYPKDKRPRKAISECRKWARTGIFKMADVRKASLSAHAAARKCKNDAACFAARAAGQAIATAHAPGHSIAAAWYAEKAAVATAIDNESEWQYQRLPKCLVAKLKR